jgi:hypothetical protein
MARVVIQTGPLWYLFGTATVPREILVVRVLPAIQDAPRAFKQQEDC